MDADVEKDTNNIFVFGMAILFGWAVVICVCAAPHVSALSGFCLLLLRI